jgi:hypothetical protein
VYSVADRHHVIADPNPDTTLKQGQGSNWRILRDFSKTFKDFLLFYVRELFEDFEAVSAQKRKKWMKKCGKINFAANVVLNSSENIFLG